MKKITLLSNTMITLFSLYLIWLPLSFVFAWYLIGFPPMTPSTIHFQFVSDSPYKCTLGIGNTIGQSSVMNPAEVIMRFSQLSFSWKLLGFCIGMSALLLSMWMVLLIIQLFKQYRTQQIFRSQNAVLLQKISLIFFVTQLIYFCGEVLGSYLYTLSTKPTFAFKFGTHEFSLLIVGLIILVVSFIMHEGYKIKDEQLLTI